MSVPLQGYVVSVLLLIVAVMDVGAGGILSGVTGLLLAIGLGAGARGMGQSEAWGWWVCLLVDLMVLGSYAAMFTRHGLIWPDGVLSAASVWFLGALLVDWMKEPQAASH